MGMQLLQTQLPSMTAGIPYDTPMLAELLAPVYESHMIGKHHVGYCTWKHTPIGRGFKSFLGFLQGQVDYYAHTVGIATEGIASKTIDGLDFWDNRKPLHKSVGNYTLDFYQERMRKIVKDYISKRTTVEEQKQNPLFLYLAHQIPHIPLQARKDEARCKHFGLGTPRRTYCSMIVELDDAIGEFIKMYTEAGLWENTFVFIMTDNGGMTNWNKDENGYPIFPASVGSNFPLRGSKATLFEGGVRGLGVISGGAIRQA